MKDISKIQYAANILETIGNTPLVKLNKITKGLKPHVFVKVEFFNPGGSVKDRIGVSIIDDAEKSGRLKPGGTIVESTSGNTGMGLALVAAIKGYKTIFTMPDKMSMEKIRVLRAFGAEVIITPTAVPHDSPESYAEVAKKIAAETPNAILANQYYNPKNIESHYKSTGPEIWKQTNGLITHFVCGVGTGGTITGTGKYLKEKNPNIKIVGIDPKGSILKEYFDTKKYQHTTKTYKVEGIGQDFLPGTLDFTYIDEMIQCDDKESFLTSRRLTREEGIFTGGSAGTALAGALKLCAKLTEDDIVVVLLPDNGDKYLSKIYNDDWMRENGFLVPERINLKYILEAKSSVIPRIVSVDLNATIRKAFDIIKQYNISHLPIFSDGKNIGTLSESKVLSSILDKTVSFDDSVKKIIDSPLPETHFNQDISVAIELLTRKEPAVLVTDGSNPIGIITRFDILEYLKK
ncbi:MAG: cystathionine beta-synthase [Ignavibacteria bacterium]|nr:cystathionine beta-synthase [Ignavibacteria bacterium]